MPAARFLRWKNVCKNYISAGLWFLTHIDYLFADLGWIRRVKDNNTLVVLLHGVNQKRFVFSMFSRSMLLNGVHPHCDVYAPFLKHDHNGPVSNYAREPLRAVREWIGVHPGGRVLLVGFSSGGRVAAYIESQLPADDGVGGVTVRVLTFGAPLHGTALIGWLPAWLVDMRIGPVLRMEMQAGLESLPPVRPKRYMSVVAGDDWYVYPPENACVAGQKAFVEPNHGHLSLMSSAAAHRHVWNFTSLYTI